MKNNTQIASLLGTWTGETHLKTDIGSYELSAYFVIHFMPDPTREYACTLSDCSEFQNHVCKWNMETKKKQCIDLTTSSELLDWSDINAFVYFGAKVDVGFPFNKHRSEDTGGWIGPLNIIMAQDDIDSSTGPVTLDRYASRYVTTPITQLIRMPENCTLLERQDFDMIVGKNAVINTVQGQYDLSGDDDDDKDPYEKYKHTCENGDVKPMLPLFHFDFIQDSNTGTESINVKLKYKLMTIPSKKDYMYEIYPQIQQRFNRLNTGFQISGPYCYGNDPNRGYSFDMNFDSTDPKEMIKVQHGCVEGLPCLPTAATLYTDSTNSIPVTPFPDDATTVSVVPIIIFTCIVLGLVGLASFLFRQNRILKQKLRELDGPQIRNSDEITAPFQQLDTNAEIEEDDSMSDHQPLIEQV